MSSFRVLETAANFADGGYGDADDVMNFRCEAEELPAALADEGGCLPEIEATGKNRLEVAGVLDISTTQLALNACGNTNSCRTQADEKLLVEGTLRRDKQQATRLRLLGPYRRTTWRGVA